MISEHEIAQVVERNAAFKSAIIDCRYDPQTDRVELVTSWCTLIVERKRIGELESLSPNEIEGIYASETGLHIDIVNVDINSAGLITDLCQRLENDVAESF
jgi:hypothetical protein